MTFDFKPITKICLNITEMCQCACPFCFAEYHPHRISYQVAKDAADWIIKNSELTGEVGSIGFFGGEPLLEWDTIIVPLTKYIKDERGLKDFELGVTTNCLLLDEEKLKFMKSMILVYCVLLMEQKKLKIIIDLVVMDKVASILLMKRFL